MCHQACKQIDALNWHCVCKCSVERNIQVMTGYFRKVFLQGIFVEKGLAVREMCFNPTNGLPPSFCVFLFLFQCHLGP